MGDQLAALYKSLFLGQVEKGEQTKKGASKRRKTSGVGLSSVKKVKKDPFPPPLKDVVEAEDMPEVQAVPPPEPAISCIVRSPATSVDLLRSLAKGPSAEDVEER